MTDAQSVGRSIEVRYPTGFGAENRWRARRPHHDGIAGIALISPAMLFVKEKASRAIVTIDLRPWLRLAPQSR